MSSISGQKPRDENPQMNSKGNEMSYQGRMYAIRVFDNDKPVKELSDSLRTFLQEELAKQKSQLTSDLIHLDITVDEHGDYSAYSWMGFITEGLLGTASHFEVFVVPNEIESINWSELIETYNYDLNRMFQEVNITDPGFKFHIIDKYKLWEKGNYISFFNNLHQLGLTDSQRLQLIKLIATNNPDALFAIERLEEYPIQYFEIFLNAYIDQRGLENLAAMLDDIVKFTDEQKDLLEKIFQERFPAFQLEQQTQQKLDFLFSLFISSILDDTNHPGFIDLFQEIRNQDPDLFSLFISNKNLIILTTKYDKREIMKFLIASGASIPRYPVVKSLIKRICYDVTASDQPFIDALLLNQELPLHSYDKSLLFLKASPYAQFVYIAPEERDSQSIKNVFYAYENNLEKLDAELDQSDFGSAFGLRNTTVKQLQKFRDIRKLLHEYESNLKKLDIALDQLDFDKVFELRNEMLGQLQQLRVLGYPDTPRLLEGLRSNSELQSVHIDKPAYHFLLDKIGKKKSPFSLGHVVDHARVLSKALEDALATLKEDEISQVNITTMLGLIQSLTFAQKWNELNPGVELFESGLRATTLVEELRNLKPGKTPALFPFTIITGTLTTHSVAIAVEKQKDGTARLTLYNTGKGIEKHHYPLKDSKPKRYQTFLTIDNIPIEKLYDHKLWLKLLQGQQAIDSFYENFEKFGKISPKSTNPLDYEQAQMRDTCSAQCLMAFLRHQILEMPGGSDLLRKGTYKFLKARTLIALGEKLLSRVDQALKPLVEKQLAKLRSDLFLAEVAKDSDQFQEYKELIFGLYKELSGQEFPNLDQLHWLEQFAFLRDCKKKVQALVKADPLKFQSILSNKSESEVEKIKNLFGELPKTV